jgi:phosphopantothenoylcysteine decarboxylase/phosphopantothenate--cysteine ligase
MRYISANSKGGTGVWIAKWLSYRAGLKANLDTTLLGSPVALEKAKTEYLSASPIEFDSTRDLMRKVETWVRSHPRGIIVHSAAVGDYEGADVSESKISSGLDELVLRLKPTPKILDEIRGWDPSAFIVSFKAASPETDREALERVARKQMERTDSDIVFANVIERFSKGIYVVHRDHSVWFEERTAAMHHLVNSIPLE